MFSIVNFWIPGKPPNPYLLLRDMHLNHSKSEIIYERSIICQESCPSLPSLTPHLLRYTYYFTSSAPLTPHLPSPKFPSLLTSLSLLTALLLTSPPSSPPLTPHLPSLLTSLPLPSPPFSSQSTSPPSSPRPTYHRPSAKTLAILEPHRLTRTCSYSCGRCTTLALHPYLCGVFVSI